MTQLINNKPWAIIHFTWILMLMSACSHEVAEVEADFSAIENGLIPPLVIGDTIDIEKNLEEQMAFYNVPGVSLAVFKDGEIVWQKAYGLKKAGTEMPVDANTKFQAASISKAVTALGVFRLSEKYDLDIDADVNTYLKTWKVEDGPFTEKEKVSIRRLLNHTAGVNVSGFRGYEKSAEIPTTAGVLNGEGNTPKIGLDTVPGTSFSYSGGGFTILQQLIEDVSGQSFTDYFSKEVFEPLQMDHSSFYPDPGNNVSIAHDKEGKPLTDDWYIYPELAAAGLWTTPSDLAQFAMSIEAAYYDEPGAIISTDLAKEMLTKNMGWGLGVGLRGEGDETFFFHGGANPGAYKCLMADVYPQKMGIVIMTNAEQGSILHDEIMRSFSNYFQWNQSPINSVQPISLSKEELEKYIGKYHYREAGDYFLEVYKNDENRLVLYDPNDGMKKTFVAVDDLTFVEVLAGTTSTFTRDSLSGKIESMHFDGFYRFHKTD